jgi:hypothetical protein
MIGDDIGNLVMLALTNTIAEALITPIMNSHGDPGSTQVIV